MIKFILIDTMLFPLTVINYFFGKEQCAKCNKTKRMFNLYKVDYEYYMCRDDDKCEKTLNDQPN